LERSGSEKRAFCCSRAKMKVDRKSCKTFRFSCIFDRFAGKTRGFSRYRIPLAARKKPAAQGGADAAGSGLVAIWRKRAFGWAKKA